MSLIFLAIGDEALVHVREVHLARYKKENRPTRAERQELEELCCLLIETWQSFPAWQAA
jgi:hypothetical protein